MVSCFQEVTMGHSECEQALSYPLPRPAALEPPPEWTRLRQRCPMARATAPTGEEMSLVTRYADVRQVLSDPRFGRTPAHDASGSTDTEPGGLFDSDVARALPTMGKEHERWRRTIGAWFTARRMLGLRPGMEAMAEQLVDDMVARGCPADLKASLGFPLPVWVICDLLGVPSADRDRFAHWSDTFLNLT